MGVQGQESARPQRLGAKPELPATAGDDTAAGERRVRGTVVQQLHEERWTVRRRDLVERQIALLGHRGHLDGRKLYSEEEVGVRHGRVHRLEGEHMAAWREAGGQSAQIDGILCSCHHP